MFFIVYSSQLCTEGGLPESVLNFTFYTVTKDKERDSALITGILFHSYTNYVSVLCSSFSMCIV